MGKAISLISAAILLGLASTAQAGVSDDFAACDGRMKPKGSDDGMRGEAAVKPSWQSWGAGKGPQTVIAACDKMLVHPSLKPAQVVRRAHMLRARAAAKLELGKAAEALVDLDAAEAAAASKAQDPFYQRSMGVSLRMLRALALAQSGDRDAAGKLAEAAAAERPYAVQIQLAAAMLRPDAVPGAEPGSATASANALRLDPGSAMALARKAAHAGAFDEVVRLGALAQLQEQPRPAVNAMDPINAQIEAIQRSIAASALQYDLAFALAATGKPDQAREVLAKARGKVNGLMSELKDSSPAPATAAPASTPADPAAAPPVPVPVPPPSPSRPMSASAERLVEARIALAEGNTAEAARLAQGSMPMTAATAELLYALNKAEGKPPPLLPADMVRKSDRFGALADLLLIAPESQRSVIDYQKSRPNILGALVGGALSFGTTLLGGIERTAGFRSTANPDGTTKVEYTGNTNSAPVVQEMTLLRAAELARAAGKWGFVIAQRADYSRYMVTSQYGMEVSRVPSGYMTELTIRFTDQDAEALRSFDAVAVIDALGPLYYSQAAAKP